MIRFLEGARNCESTLNFVQSFVYLVIFKMFIYYISFIFYMLYTYLLLGGEFYVSSAYLIF